MSDFEFNSVIISILLAFALSEILSSWSRLIQHRERVRGAAIYCAASGWLFFNLILHWLGLSVYRHLEFDSFVQSLIIFSPAILGAMIAFVLAPRFADEGDLEIDRHYFSVAPWAFSLAVAYCIMAALADLVVPIEEAPALSIALTQGAVLLGLAFSRQRWVHTGGLALLWALMVSIFLAARS